MQYGIKITRPFNNDFEIESFEIDPPFDNLNIIKLFYSDLGDLDLYIRYLQDEIINANIPDFSLESGVEWELMLLGSEKSKLIEIKDGKYLYGEEFSTQDLLDFCLKWRELVVEKMEKEQRMDKGDLPTILDFSHRFCENSIKKALSTTVIERLKLEPYTYKSELYHELQFVLTNMPKSKLKMMNRFCNKNKLDNFKSTTEVNLFVKELITNLVGQASLQ